MWSFNSENKPSNINNSVPDSFMSSFSTLKGYLVKKKIVQKILIGTIMVMAAAFFNPASLIPCWLIGKPTTLGHKQHYMWREKTDSLSVSLLYSIMSLCLSVCLFVFSFFLCFFCFVLFIFWVTTVPRFPPFPWPPFVFPFSCLL